MHDRPKCLLFLLAHKTVLCPRPQYKSRSSRVYQNVNEVFNFISVEINITSICINMISMCVYRNINLIESDR